MSVYIIAPYYQAFEDSISPEDRFHEIHELVRVLDNNIIGARQILLKNISAHSYISRDILLGIAEEFDEESGGIKPDFVVVDASISASQQRNIERILRVFVDDRTSLILNIFAHRARSEEGKLQVALARLQYDASRLVRSWTHLERQRGGLGKTGGPGERQIELDRRQIRTDIEKLQDKLLRIRQKRALHRQARGKIPIPVVALVGYTNAGKTSLFNTLTRAVDYADNQVFATLDTHHRQVKLPSGRVVILTDTVGFIHNLPHHLVAAFRATLEELASASLILHIGDLGNPNCITHFQDGREIMGEFCDDQTTIYRIGNKSDLLDDTADCTILNQQFHCLISVHNGHNLNQLLQLIDNFFDQQQGFNQYDLQVKMTDTTRMNYIYKYGRNTTITQNDDNFYKISTHFTQIEYDRFCVLQGE